MPSGSDGTDGSQRSRTHAHTHARTHVHAQSTADLQVEAVYQDRVRRAPAVPWGDDTYRLCEYSVDWESGNWTVDDSRATQPNGVAGLSNKL